MGHGWEKKEGLSEKERETVMDGGGEKEMQRARTSTRSGNCRTHLTSVRKKYCRAVFSLLFVSTMFQLPIIKVNLPCNPIISLLVVHL